jgi:hypothetical protein
MNHVVKKLLSGRDNKTPDIGRYSWAICIGAVIGLTGVSLYLGVAVTVLEFASALSIITTAHGAALGLKKDTEPTPEQQDAIGTEHA